MGRYKLPYTLYKRGKYWYYRTYTIDGRRTVPKSTGCRTKGDAVRFCEQLSLNGALTDSNINFYNYAHSFFEDGSFFLTDRVRPLANNTLKRYRSNYNSVIEPYFKDYKLKDINYVELRKFRASLINQGLKISSINTYFMTLKIIIESAYKQDLISRNPFDKLESLDSDVESKNAYTLEQVRQLYQNINPEYKNLVLLLALTGMRVNEALGVRTCDIFSAEKTKYIKLNKQVDSKGNYQPLKTKLSREVPIIPEIEKLVNNNFLYNSFYKVYRRLNEKLFGTNSKTSIHSLRHFFITNTKANNINTTKIKVISGHALDNKVEDTYTNFRPDDLTDVLPWQKETLKLITE